MDARALLRDYLGLRTVPFWGVHAIALVGVLWAGWSWQGVLLAVGSYVFRMFFVTAGYHRYFSHRTYKTSRAFQLVLATLGGTASQKGALWWAAHHREHHKRSDEPGDPHSPRQRGLAWAHVGWIVSKDNDRTHVERITDLVRYPELAWLNRFWIAPVVGYAVAWWLIGGWHGLLWGFFVSTVLLWHGTFVINSLTHVWGRRRFPSGDDSRNHWLLALVTLGEGWHNNHHHYESSTTQGFYWWEIDPTFWVLRLFAAARVVWDLRRPPLRVLEHGRQLDALLRAGGGRASASRAAPPVVAV